MKIYVLIGLTLLAVGCEQQSSVDYSIVEGSIENAHGKTLALNTLTGDFNKKITLEDDGSFIDTLQITSGTFSLSDGRQKMQFYLEEGDRLHVNYDAAKPGTWANFEGSAAASAVYYRTKEELTKDLKNGIKNIYTLDERTFLEQLNKQKEAHKKLLQGAKSLSRSFQKLEERNIDYEYLNQVNNYEMYHAYYTGNKGFKASDIIEEELRGINMEDKKAFRFSPAFRNLLTSTYNQKASAMVKKDTIEPSLALLKVIAENGDQEIRDELLYENAKTYLSYSEDPEAYYNFYMAYSSNKEYQNAVTKDFDKMRKIAKGKPSPIFRNYENHEGGTTSLNDLKGKYVYMDIWATWCGPCKREIPSLKELEMEYRNKDIVFVSISIDEQKDHDKWKNMVTQLELGGVQLFADNDWNSQFVKDYLIKGIPRFILVDPQGNIVNSNAPRPSSEDIRKLFNELEI
ncbi:TlpA family protein disulfide reductase [Robertkochia marina]|uniref:TlpA family protein disulfide reductase n=1 Tax=Robertkochia marina TaxID=1227945 RepID=A0A4S3M1U8_9FLAO|nr:TlpA disulfide reductase family protein [Robertkochia marina]THD67539.1 TlpA family protein disulfide reductase [Robertkochia marina]TRZ44593.1 TlpA family protein disulfide reductase [Robertkochia marina]